MIDGETKRSRQNRDVKYLLTRVVPACIIVFLILFFLLWRFGAGLSKQGSIGDKTTPELLQELGQSEEFVKLFAGSLSNLSKLDTDKDGTADIKDVDDDNDGQMDIVDQDDDNDGLVDADDVSTASVSLVSYITLKGEKGDKGDSGEAGVAGQRGAAGSAGAAGAPGATGPQGPTGTIGVVTDDGVIDTTLTGGALNVQLLLATGSGLEKTGSGLSLTTVCNNNELLKWNGSAWACGTDNGGISYTAGAGITISAGVVSSILGTSVDTSEITDGTILFADLGQNSCGTGQIIKWNGSSWACATDIDTDTDTQDLSLASNTLSLVNGGSVSLAAYLDNTDVLAGLSCSSNQIPKYNGSAWACSADVDTNTDTDDQTLSWNSGTSVLTIVDGNNVNLGSLLDNTDSQAISRTGNTLSITGNAGTVDLSSYLDNTDAQALSLSGSTLSISGGNSINLAPIDTDDQTLSLSGGNLTIAGGNTINISSINTDTLATLSCSNNQIAKWNGTAWACAADIDTDTDTDAQTLSLSSNNLTILNGNSVSLAGYLDNTDAQTLSFNSGTSVLTISSGNTANLSALLDNTDSQAISRTGNTLSITGNAGTVDLSSYIDNTDVLASLSCTSGQVAQWNGSVWICASAAVDTDDQTLSLSSNNLSIDNGNSVSLAGYLDNTDAQDLTLSSNILALSGDGTTVNLSAYLDNTDVLASLSCSNNQIPKWNGTAWACAADLDTDTDTQDLSLAGNTLSLVAGGSVDLSVFLDNTDNQDLSLSGNILSLSNDGTTVNLAAYLDNTDSQNLFFTIDAPNGTDPTADSATDTLVFADGSGITITGNSATDTVTIATVLGTSIESSEITNGTITFADISANSCTTDNIFKFNGTAWYCGTDIDTDTVLTESQIEAYIFDADNTGTLSSGTLALGSLSFTGSLSDTNVADALTISASGSVADGALSANVTKLGTSIESSEITNGTITGTDIASATISFSNLSQNGCTLNQIPKWNGSAWACAADVDTDTDTDTQDLTLVADTLSLVNGGSVSLAAYLDNTDNQDLSLTGNTLALSNDGTTVNLSAYLDNTDVLASLSCSNNQIPKWNGSAWACAADLDTDTDTQDLSLAGNTLSLTAGGSVDLSAYLDNTDSQSLFFTVNTDNGTDPQADSATDTLNFVSGSGVTITGNSTTDTVTIASVLGTTIESSEITDGTITFADISANSCTTNNIFKFNGTAWYCGTDVDTDTVLNEAQVEAYIFDADNTGTLSSGTLALGSLSYTGTLSDTNVADALTISASGSVADGALSANVTKLGGSIESAEITNGTITGTDIASATITFGNIGQNGCTTNQIPKWNGSAWACAADLDTDTDTQDLSLVSNTLSLIAGGSVDLSSYLDNTDVLASLSCSNNQIPKWNGSAWACSADLDTDTQDLNLTGNTLSLVAGGSVDLSTYLDNTDSQNLFLTINVDNGTDPVADSVSDALNLVSGSGVTVTGDSTTDTITIAAVLGTAVDGSEITDGSVANADLANSSVTVSAGNGLANGGSVSLGGSTTINIGAGNGITVNADDIAVRVAASADALSSTTSSGSGLEVLASGVALIQGCANGQTLKWSEATDVWACANDTDTDTDTQDLSLASNILSLVAGGSVDLTPYLDNTDNQDLTLSSNILALTNDGTTVNLSAYLDNTDVLAGLSCTTNQIPKWNGSAWACAADIDTDTDTQDLSLVANTLSLVAGGSVDLSTYLDNTDSQNLFLTINTDNGSDPVADSATDALNLISGSGVTVTGDSSTDSITIAAVIGSTIDSSAEIVDGVVANVDLVNSSVTVSAGNGLANGGSVSLGGSTTINIGAGNGIVVNADDIAVRIAVSADALSSTTSSGSGIEVLATGIALLQGCSDGQVLKWNETTDVWACAGDSGITSEIDGIVGNEVTDATVSGGLTRSGSGTGGSPYTLGITAGGVTNAMLTNSSLTLTAGSGLTNAGAVSLGGSTTINIGAGNGITVNADDIAVRAAASADGLSATTSSGSGLEVLATGVTMLQGCANNQILKWNETTDVWACAADVDTDTNTDAQTLTLLTNTLSISGGNNVNLAAYLDNTDNQNLFLTYDVDNGTDPVADSATDTLSFVSGAGVTITGNSATDTITVAAVLGATIDSSAEIVDGIIANVDLANSSVTVAAGSGLANGGAVSLGGSTTLNIGAGNGITVNADDIAVRVVASVDGLSATTSSGSGLEVLATGVALIQGCSDGQLLKWNETTDVWACANDTDTNTDNQNLFLTYDIDNGTDPVADTATDTLSFVSGSGVTVTGNSTTDSITIAAVLGISIDSSEIVDGTVSNTDLANSSLTITAGSGLTTGGLVSLGGTVALNIGAGTGITVNADDIGITADGLNFTELSDALSLDTATTISLGANNLTTNLSGTGDYVIQFAGNTVFSILETGAVSIGSILSDQTIGLDNGTGTINIATDTDANIVNIGTGTGADTVNIGDANANVALSDAQWSITGAGAANFASTTGSGLVDCDQSDDSLKWDSTTGLFSCGTNRATFHNSLNSDYTNTTTTFAEIDGNADATDDIGFAIGANETWVFEAVLYVNSPAAADNKFQVTAPAGATCVVGFENSEDAVNVGNIACGTTSGTLNSTGANDVIRVNGTIINGANAGNVMVMHGQATASGTSTIVDGSYIIAYRTSGADYAEIYYSVDRAEPGFIVELTGEGPSQVKRANTPYSDKQIGIVSTKPGKVLGESDGSGTPVPIALSGRVPIKLTTENGLPKAGDMITASSTKLGYGMLATKSGYIVGQLMTDATDNGDGTAAGFVYVRHGYWQAPVTINLNQILGHNMPAKPLNDDQEVSGFTMISGTEFNSFDQAAVDEIMRGFTVQQGSINDLSGRLTVLENSYAALNPSYLNDLLKLESGVLSFTSDVSFVGDVTFKGDTLFSSNTAGTATIPAGGTSIDVIFVPSRQKTPAVVVSPNDFVNGQWKQDSTSPNKFTIRLSEPQAQDVTFNWQAIVTSEN